MSSLRVSSWKRYGHDRLYVNRPDGTSVAWLDRKTGHLHVLDEGYEDRARAVLSPHMIDAALVDEPEQASSLPAKDLAANEPGDALRGKLDELGSSGWRYQLLRLLGRKQSADSWRSGLKGEQAVGRELGRLAASGWLVLHSLPLPRGVDIDHLLIGPGGVFSVNTKRHPGAAVWVGDDSVKLGGRAYPYVRKSRGEASRASRALTRGCGFAVDVQPMLVFVGTAKITVSPTLLDVRIAREREVSALGPLAGVLTTTEVENVYDVARDSRTWSSL